MSDAKKPAQPRTLEQQIADQEAKLQRLRERKKNAEAQHKIIVGALMLKAAETDYSVASYMLHYLRDNASERDLQRLGDTLETLAKHVKKLQPPAPAEQPPEQPEQHHEAEQQA